MSGMLAIDLNPIGGIGDAIEDAARNAGEAVLGMLTGFVFGLIADAVAAITDAIIAAMNSTTAVDLEGGFFPALTPIRQTVLAMSVTLVLALVFLSVIRALIAGEPGAVVRAGLVDAPAALFLMALSVTVAWVLVRVIDAASLAVTGDVGEAMGEFTATLVVAESLAGSGLLGMTFGLLFVFGAILVWLQLLVRSALIYIVVVLAPLGLATRTHPGTRQIPRRTIELGVALIVSKFGVAVAFGVGAAAIDSSNELVEGSGVDLAGMAMGVAVMLMAAFMPWLIWKVFPVVEAATAAAGVERAPVKAAVSAASLGVAAGLGVARLAGGGGAAGSGGSGAGGAGGSTGAGSAGGGSGGAGSGSSSASPTSTFASAGDREKGFSGESGAGPAVQRAEGRANTVALGGGEAGGEKRSSGGNQ